MALSSLAWRSLLRSSSPRLSPRRDFILGIETSCDDTGAAVVSLEGALLGESLSTQQAVSTSFGGIIPTFARHFHEKKIEGVVQECLAQAGVSLPQLTAVAVTNRPGLQGPLVVGTDYAKYLCLKHRLPLIPVHHMEAHALTARMDRPHLAFPFLVLLISGGHCLLAHCRDIDQFTLLGSSIDDSPGEALDKCARMLGLHHMSQFRHMSGGAAIEVLARSSYSPRLMSVPMRGYRDCRFSFAGVKSQIYDIVRLAGLEPGQRLPEGLLADICSGLQHLVTKHLAERVQRGCDFLELAGELPASLVVSGGVASNLHIREGLATVAGHYKMEAVFPPPRLCTDNGVMIAWAGLERWRLARGVVEAGQVLKVEVESRAPLGTSLHEKIEEANIRCKWIKLWPYKWHGEHTSTKTAPRQEGHGGTGPKIEEI